MVAPGRRHTHETYARAGHVSERGEDTRPNGPPFGRLTLERVGRVHDRDILLATDCFHPVGGPLNRAMLEQLQAHFVRGVREKKDLRIGPRQLSSENRQTNRPLVVSCASVCALETLRSTFEGKRILQIRDWRHVHAFPLLRWFVCSERGWRQAVDVHNKRLQTDPQKTHHGGPHASVLNGRASADANAETARVVHDGLISVPQLARGGVDLKDGCTINVRHAMQRSKLARGHTSKTTLHHSSFFISGDIFYLEKKSTPRLFQFSYILSSDKW